VQVVQKWWAQMQREDVEEHKEKGQSNANIRLQLPIIRIVKKFVEWKIFQDQTSARRYLLENDADYDDDDVTKEYFEFNDFLAIFLKGIFKDVVCGIASTAYNFRRKDQQNEPLDNIQKRSLLWKLSDYKRENMFELLEKGMVKHKYEQQKIVKRPIFTNLYNLKYRTDPEKWKNRKYEDFLDETIHKKPEIEDPFEVPLDEYELALNIVGRDFCQEVEYFEKIKGYNIKPNVNSLEELEQYFEDLVHKRINLRPEQTLQNMSDEKTTRGPGDLAGGRLQQSSSDAGASTNDSEKKLDIIDVMYPSERKRERFDLNKEKNHLTVLRGEFPSNLVDVLSKQERLDEEKKLLQDLTIEKHHKNQKRLYLYNNPDAQQDPNFDQKFERMNQMSAESTHQKTAGSDLQHAEPVSKKEQAGKDKEKADKEKEQASAEKKEAANPMHKVVMDIRELQRSKYELLKQCQDNLQMRQQESMVPEDIRRLIRESAS